MQTTHTDGTSGIETESDGAPLPLMSTTVVGTALTGYYHVADAALDRESRNTIEVTRQQAEGLGYTPCPICYRDAGGDPQ